MIGSTLTDERRARLHGRVKFIVFFTITWNVIEAIIALSAGSGVLGGTDRLRAGLGYRGRLRGRDRLAVHP